MDIIFMSKKHLGKEAKRNENLLAQISVELGLETPQGKRALALALECIQLLDSKQQDYGPRNISYSGELGIAVRQQDKVCRLKHLLENGRKANHESKRDTYMDMANYGLIGLMLDDGTWTEGS
jgi:hypothetical protein